VSFSGRELGDGHDGGLERRHAPRHLKSRR
jgi:hypothetical protein